MSLVAGSIVECPESGTRVSPLPQYDCGVIADRNDGFEPQERAGRPSLLRDWARRCLSLELEGQYRAWRPGGERGECGHGREDGSIKLAVGGRRDPVQAQPWQSVRVFRLGADDRYVLSRCDLR